MRSVRALFARRRIEREMEADFRFHVDERIDDLVGRGMPREEAVRTAQREFGNVLRWREDGREARGLHVIDDLRADVRYGFRWLLRSPAFALTAILSLALGIGANAAMFSLIDAVLLRSLPVERPQELVIYAMKSAGFDSAHAFSYRMFETMRHEVTTLVDTLAMSPIRFGVTIGEREEPTANGQLVSGNYYAVLGVRPMLGRLLEPADDTPGDPRAVTVLSHGYWQRRFGGRDDVLGATIRLNGVPVTVVGVSSKEFWGTHVGSPVEISVPLSLQPLVMAEESLNRVTGRGVNDLWLELMGRRRGDVTPAQAQAEADAIFQPIIRDFIKDAGPKGKAMGQPRLELAAGGRGLSELRQRSSRPLLVLMGAVVLVLLISCANVANLLLARAAARRREIAVRVSIGASRWRLVRQLLTESLLLSLLGGALGLLLAVWTGQTFAQWLTDGASALAIHPDRRAVAFTFAVSLLTTAIFGLVPAFGASSIDANAALKEAGRGSIGGTRRLGLRSALVVVQVAISVVLLVCAGLFVRTLVELRRVDLGMDREHVLSLRLEPRGSNQKRPEAQTERLRRLYNGILDGVRSTPGVRAAGLAGSSPLGSESSITPEIAVPGYVARPGENMRIRMMQIFPGYFAALGVPLLAGRDLAVADDRPDAPVVAVINDTMARRFFGTPAAAIGRQFGGAVGGRPFEIVGVLRDTRERTIREDTLPTAYSTFAHTPTGRGQMTLVVRTANDPSAIVPVVLQLARQADPSMPMFEPQTLEDRVASVTRQEQVLARLSALFGVVGTVLAAIGLYGVLAYAVARRRTELGVRLALGATPAGLERLVLRESVTLVAGGLIIGVAASVAAARALSQMLFGLPPIDPWSFGAALLLLILVATVAAWVPARRAARTDPLIALRQDG